MAESEAFAGGSWEVSPLEVHSRSAQKVTAGVASLQDAVQVEEEVTAAGPGAA